MSVLEKFIKGVTKKRFLKTSFKNTVHKRKEAAFSTGDLSFLLTRTTPPYSDVIGRHFHAGKTECATQCKELEHRVMSDFCSLPGR